VGIGKFEEENHDEMKAKKERGNRLKKFKGKDVEARAQDMESRMK